MPKSMDITEDCALAPKYHPVSVAERTECVCIVCYEMGVDSALMFHLDPPKNRNLPYFALFCHLRCFLNSRRLSWGYLVVPIKWVH